jgi:signal peptidase I
MKLTILYYFILVVGAVFFNHLLASIPARIANKKGRSFYVWYAYGFVFLLFALPHSLLIKKNTMALGDKKLADATVSSNKKKEDSIGDTIKTIFWALLFAGLIRTLLVQPYWIPSGSMKDTLLIGDFLFVNKMAYGYSKHSCPWSLCPFSGRIFSKEPKRGDVVVFKHPTTGADFIKRLVGLPGEKIQMKDGYLYINNIKVNQISDGVFEERNEIQGPMQSTRPACSKPTGMGMICTKEKFISELPNGVSHSVLNVSSGQFLDNTGIYSVPDNHYFFMGDNRDNSSDSRVLQPRGIGFVPLENIVGRADRLLFSSAGKSILYFWTWRSDRYFKSIN